MLAMLSRVFTTREQLLMLGSAAAICVGGVTYYIARPDHSEATVEVREFTIHAPVQEAPKPELSPVTPPAVQPVMTPLNTNPAPVQRRISVSVAGAVTTPGVYEFDEGERVEHAIKTAGGETDMADTSDINKAAELMDGSALVIPFAAQQGLRDGKTLVLRNGQQATALNPPEYTISGWKNAARKQPARSSGPNDSPNASSQKSTTGLLDLNTASAQELETLPGIGPTLASAIVQYRAQQRFTSVDDLNNVPGIGEKRLNDLRPHVSVTRQ
ncbi:MAG: helix-hairpin-helix domain-containing protein [Candidatus Hydrogenedentes bacterium]|nr:helix-hairpin-helix domain-containing protein [Candidatus Hydrogenedentota bacterium]